MTQAHQDTDSHIKEPDTSYVRLPADSSAAIIVFIVASLIRIPTSLPLGYQVDDFVWYLKSHEFSVVGKAQLALGRALAALTGEGLFLLGSNPPHATGLHQLLMTAALCFLGVTLSRLWAIKGFVVNAIFIGLMTMHPFMSEIYALKIAPIYMAIAVLLMALSLQWLETWRDKKSWSHFFLATIAASASIGLYQVMVGYFAIVAILTLWSGLLLQGTKDVTTLKKPFDARSLLNTSFFRQVIVILVAIPTYLLAHKLVNHHFGVPMNSRAKILQITFGDMEIRYDQIIALLKNLYVSGTPLTPRGTSMVGAVLLACLVSFLVLRMMRSRKTINVMSTLALGALLPLSFALTIGVQLALQEWYPVPRIMTHTGIWWAVMFTSLVVVAPFFFRRLALALGCLLFFSYASVSAHIGADQIRISQRDFNKVNRMVARLESMDGFDKVQYVFIYGDSMKPGDYDGIPARFGDMNLSAFHVHWSRSTVFKEATGLSLTPPDDPDALRGKRSWAEGYCSQASKWPAPGSIAINDNSATICLTVSP